ncbi:MAG TPA: hypothetical protein VH592_20720 [Gemmataceae bacterium]
MDRRHLRLLLLVVVLIVFTTLLWFYLWSPVPEPDPLTTAVLEAAAERWWRPHTGHRWNIPEEEWPPELLRLRPKAVRVAPEGVFIPFKSVYIMERGLFILPRASNYQPQQGMDPSFQVLRGRVYKYEVKG